MRTRVAASPLLLMESPSNLLVQSTQKPIEEKGEDHEQRSPYGGCEGTTLKVQQTLVFFCCCRFAFWVVSRRGEPPQESVSISMHVYARTGTRRWSPSRASAHLRLLFLLVYCLLFSFFLLQLPQLFIFKRKEGKERGRRHSFSPRRHSVVVTLKKKKKKNWKKGKRLAFSKNTFCVWPCRNTHTHTHMNREAHVRSHSYIYE